MNKIVSKKEIFKVKSLPYDPESIAEPLDVDGFIHRGTPFFARKECISAVNDLNQAIDLDSDIIDSFYLLEMVYKAEQEIEKSDAAFRRVLELINVQPDTDKVRKTMLRRLA